MTSSSVNTNARKGSKATRRDSLGLSSVFTLLPRTTFEKTIGYHPRQRESRRVSLVNLGDDTVSASERSSTIPLEEGNKSAAFTRFLESCIELYVHKIVAAVMLDGVDDEISEALEDQSTISEEIDDVQAELDEVREEKATLMPVPRRNTVHGPETTGKMPSLMRCRTTDGVPSRRPTLASQAVSSQTLPTRACGCDSSTDDLQRLLISETNLKVLRRELLAQRTELGTQIARLQWQAQGSGIMRRSFQRVQAKVRQRQKEQWLELAEMMMRREEATGADGKAKMKVSKVFWW